MISPSVLLEVPHEARRVAHPHAFASPPSSRLMGRLASRRLLTRTHPPHEDGQNALPVIQESIGVGCSREAGVT